jgi:hypothetical protein
MKYVTFKCGQGDCVWCYTSFNCLARHLRYHHTDSRELAKNACVEHDIIGDLTNLSSEQTSSVFPTMQCVGLERDRISADSSVSSLLSSTAVTERIIQSVIEHTSAFVAEIVQDPKVVSTVAQADVLNSNECAGLLTRKQNHAGF